MNRIASTPYLIKKAKCHCASIVASCHWESMLYRNVERELLDCNWYNALVCEKAMWFSYQWFMSWSIAEYVYWGRKWYIPPIRLDYQESSNLHYKTFILPRIMSLMDCEYPIIICRYFCYACSFGIPHLVMFFNWERLSFAWNKKRTQYFEEWGIFWSSNTKEIASCWAEGEQGTYPTKGWERTELCIKQKLQIISKQLLLCSSVASVVKKRVLWGKLMDRSSLYEAESTSYNSLNSE